ncbi:MAG: hypothetical protein QXI11_04935 [Thermoproteota archaeon]
MKIAIIRRVRHSAGSLQRLYWVVRAASESEVVDFQTLRERYVQMVGKDLGQRKPLSVTDLVLAHELDLLEREREGAWSVSFGVGRAFLALWSKLRQAPKHLLLVQFIKYDHTFLREFLKALFNANFPHTKVSLKDVTEEAYNQLWKKHGQELLRLEPPFPRQLKGKYAWKHYADFRMRFLTKKEGLNLNDRQLYQLYDKLEKGIDESTLFFTVGEIMNNSSIERVDDQTLMTLLNEAYRTLKGVEFASAYGAFCYINELALTYRKCAIDWNTFSSMLRRNSRFSLQPSFRGREDILFKIVS